MGTAPINAVAAMLGAAASSLPRERISARNTSALWANSTATMELMPQIGDDERGPRHGRIIRYHGEAGQRRRGDEADGRPLLLHIPDIQATTTFSASPSSAESRASEVLPDQVLGDLTALASSLGAVASRHRGGACWTHTWHFSAGWLRGEASGVDHTPSMPHGGGSRRPPGPTVPGSDRCRHRGFPCSKRP